MNLIKNVTAKEGYNKALGSISAILIGLVVGFLVLLLANPANAFDGFITIIAGGFTGGGRGVGQVLYFATPLILTGLSVGVAFKTGMFNIGASGQFVMGAVAAVVVGVHVTLPAPIHWIVALLAAAIVGGIWGFIPGMLKAFFNVHEVIATIMMNYIGMYLCNFIVKETVYNSLKNISLDVQSSAVLPKAGLDKIFVTMHGTYADTSTLNSGILIAIGTAVLIYFIMEKTTLGYELKAVGFNKNASKYAGMNEKRNIILSMTIAGALAGLGGGLTFLSGHSGRHLQVVDVLAGEGFNGISVALLGLSNPIGIIFSAIFISYLTQGGTYLQTFNYMPEVIDIIIAVIIYFSAFALVLRQILPKLKKKLQERKAERVAASEIKESNGGEK
ncbi:MAG: ABC transporter permease [Peptostreptococcaceae bacterium]|nr:ABC transporter permease [Peptostreptococcaceae bacterium]